MCILASVARQQTTTDSYEATASVTFGNASLSDAALQVDRSSGDPERDAATNVLIARSLEVATGVREQLGVQVPAGQLLSAISVEAAPNANVLDMTATAEVPKDAADLANAFADQYISFERQSQIDSIEEAQRDLETQLDALPQGSAERTSLQASLQRLGELRAVASGGAQIIGRASVPDTPANMSLRTAVLLGAIIGLALSLLVVFLLEALDRRISTIEELEREYRLTALSAIPQSVFSGRGRDRDDHLEPYRILRSSLNFIAATRQLETLLVTSAIEDEGKTTVAIELAYAIALTGRSVALVELDLRRPSFHRRFELDRSLGATSVLTHQAELSEVLTAPVPELPDLAVLPAGPLPPNPSELLGTPAVSEMLAELASGDRIVIVDSPPLNPVADTQVLLDDPALNGVLIVGRLDHLTRDEARRARAILDRHLVEPIGLVASGLRDAAHYGYGAPAGDRTPILGEGGSTAGGALRSRR